LHQPFQDCHGRKVVSILLLKHDHPMLFTLFSYLFESVAAECFIAGASSSATPVKKGSSGPVTGS